MVNGSGYQVSGAGYRESEHSHPNALLVHADEAVLSSSRPSFRRNAVGIVCGGHARWDCLGGLPQSRCCLI